MNIRLDLPHAVKELSRSTQRPTQASLRQLWRVGHYLAGAVEYGFEQHLFGDPAAIDVWTDSDWAQTRTTWRSTSGGLATLCGA
eukprot:9125498-Alexandrium_andersonii.AAC.1